MTARDATLHAGFRLDEPNVSIAWGASVADVLKAFADLGLGEPRRVAAGYYTSACRALGGLNVQVGFRFEPQTDAGALRELELFDNGEPEIARSYQLFQEKLVQRFGLPTIERPGPLGQSMPDCEWRLGAVTITHYAMDRFGPEEHLRIRKGGASVWRNERIVSVVLVAMGVLFAFMRWCTPTR